MFNYKILFKVTGSIAAYKSAYLISKLIQNGCDVKIVASESALKFVGTATFEGLTGNQVYTDSFAPNHAMSHINLVKWADLTIVCPATANTINKLANGISDSLLTSLFLAHDWTKPYLIAPAMNSLMYDHPATQESLKKLGEWGVKILPTAEGYLACGDIGKGKLLDPDEIFEIIFDTLNQRKLKSDCRRVLITSGGTRENIDGVRYLSNVSTGKTASVIAEYFSRYGHDVVFIHSVDSILPKNNCLKIPFSSFTDLDEILKSQLSENIFDAVIHLAAVSDYSPYQLAVEDELVKLPTENKISSSHDSITISLKRNHKIIDNLKSYSKNKNLIVVGFKLTSGASADEQKLIADEFLKTSPVDYVVANDLNDRTENNDQMKFKIFNRQIEAVECQTSKDLSVELENKIRETK